MGIVLAVANQKGGVGKTATCVNLAAALSERGQGVLLVDLDPQSSLTMSLGVEVRNVEETTYALLVGRAAIPSDIGCTTGIAGVRLVPATIELVKAEVFLPRQVTRERTLRVGLEEAREAYDWTILDCPPSLGQLTVNALAAADEVLIPLQTDYLAMRGAALLMQKGIREIKAHVNPGLGILGILATFFDVRTTHSREVLEGLRAHFGGLVFRTVIRYMVAVKNAAVEHTSVLQYAPRSEVAEAYRELAREVLERHGARGNGKGKRQRLPTR